MKVEVTDSKNSRPKPPFDPFPWLYWLFFVLMVFLVPGIMMHKPGPQIRLLVFSHNVSAYHIITPNDISMKSIDQATAPTDIVNKTENLIGHYTLTTLSSGQPINPRQIGPRPDRSLIKDTLATAIAANNAMLLGGNLHAGDVVSLAAFPISNSRSTPLTIFDRVLVLDVKSSGNQAVIILAIPSRCWLNYLAKTHHTTIVLARPVN
ncbi:MAG TPA: SAF domain-containing protein [Ktedonobacteraceae bacterium]|nr:SAF domain-containing protein [Ktedonobacteraceae bacterium]